MLTIQELEAETKIPRRTIHFYIKEGLIPPPEGSRRNAQYGDEHLLRLRLIQIFKEGSHLRLEGIREILDGMSVGEMRDQLAALESSLVDPLDLVAHTLRPEPGMDSPADGVTRLKNSNLIGESFDEQMSVLSEDAPLAMSRGPKGFVARLRSMVDQGGAEEQESESWQRVRVTDDVEIHYRNMKKKKRALKIEQVIALAREILED